MGHIKSQLNDLKTMSFPTPGKVYYYQRHFDGTPSEYTHVADIGLSGGPADISEQRSIVFTYFNGEDPGVLLMVDLKFDTLRSMMVGDVVVIGETAWECKPVGWAPFDVSLLPREKING